jgi:hypothetical protein
MPSKPPFPYAIVSRCPQPAFRPDGQTVSFGRREYLDRSITAITYLADNIQRGREFRASPSRKEVFWIWRSIRVWLQFDIAQRAIDIRRMNFWHPSRN